MHLLCLSALVAVTLASQIQLELVNLLGIVCLKNLDVFLNLPPYLLFGHLTPKDDITKLFEA